MTDDLLPELPDPPKRSRWTTVAALIILGLVLLISAGVVLIGYSTATTSSLVHRGDCRARFQGEFDKDLAELVREAIRVQPSPAKLDTITRSLQGDAKQYQQCTRTAAAAQ